MVRLLKSYKEDEILYKKSDVPEIYYFFKNRKKRYYSDFFVPKHNKVVETKSVFTLFGVKNKDEFFLINLAKFEATLKLGYILEIDLVIPYKEIVCTIEMKKIEDLMILQDKTLRLLK
jgi:hypothetical protein